MQHLNLAELVYLARYTTTHRYEALLEINKRLERYRCTH